MSYWEYSESHSGDRFYLPTTDLKRLPPPWDLLHRLTDSEVLNRLTKSDRGGVGGNTPDHLASDLALVDLSLSRAFEEVITATHGQAYNEGCFSTEPDIEWNRWGMAHSRPPLTVRRKEYDRGVFTVNMTLLEE